MYKYIKYLVNSVFYLFILNQLYSFQPLSSTLTRISSTKGWLMLRKSLVVIFILLFSCFVITANAQTHKTNPFHPIVETTITEKIYELRDLLKNNELVNFDSGTYYTLNEQDLNNFKNRTIQESKGTIEDYQATYLESIVQIKEQLLTEMLFTYEEQKKKEIKEELDRATVEILEEIINEEN